MLILDASVTLAWALPDEHSEYADSVLEHVLVQGARVPSIWILETVNAALMAEKRKRLQETDVTQFLDRLIGMYRNRRIVISELGLVPAFQDLCALARIQGLTAYDAVYLYLAKAEQLPLASIDRDLTKAATRVGVQIWG